MIDSAQEAPDENFISSILISLLGFHTAVEGDPSHYPAILGNHVFPIFLQEMATPIQTVLPPPLKIKIKIAVPLELQHELFGNQTPDNGCISLHAIKIIKSMEENKRVLQFARGAAYCCVGEGTSEEERGENVGKRGIWCSELRAISSGWSFWWKDIVLDVVRIWADGLRARERV